MKTKRVPWLLAITLLLPQVAWAEGDNDTEGLALTATADGCRATFSVSDQTLTLPCVEVVMGNETVLYSAQLQQVAEGSFALTQVAELSAAVESDCVASYSLETGELGVPCVEDVSPPEVAETRALVLYAEEPGSPSVFVRGRDRMVRAADKNLSVAFLPQSPPGDWSNTKNCGQTSVLMVMSFYKGVSPTEQGIKDIDDWLYQQYRDPVNGYNGSVTTVDKLLAVAKGKGGFTNSYRTSGWGLTELKQQIDKGYPVITAVNSKYIPFSDRGYNYAGGHFVVVKGYTSTQMIVNDPGTRYGANKYYSNQYFTTAFNAQGGAAVVVVGGSVTPPLAAPQITGVTLNGMGVTIEWQRVPAANKYRIVFSQDANFSGFTDANGYSTCNATCFTDITSFTSFPKKTMNFRNWTYYVKVRAASDTAASSWSSTVSFKTPR